jgi:hypothetical protein
VAYWCHCSAPRRQAVLSAESHRAAARRLRTALLGRGDVHWLAIGTSALVSVALFAAGTLFFLYQDRQYADVI